MTNKELLAQINFQLNQKENELREKMNNVQPSTFVLNKDINELMKEILDLQNQKKVLEAEVK